MLKSLVLRRVLLAPPIIRSSLISLPQKTTSPAARQYSTAPHIAQTSFWVSLIPKPLRKSSPTAAFKKVAKSKEWNPATFFIVIFLLIGSMSIQMIALRNEFGAFSRRADAKISLLKEIIGRIQNGEDVDVEGLLGTGDAAREKEWEEVLQEIEKEDEVWEQSRKTKPKPVSTLEDAPVNTTSSKPKTEEKSRSKAPSGFY